MTLTIDFGLGYNYAPNLITVTLRRQADGSEQSVPYVLKREVTLQDVAAEPAIIEQETCHFHLWEDHLAGTVPAKGDEVILADGSTWHVEVVQKQNHGRKFRLTAFLEHAA